MSEHNHDPADEGHSESTAYETRDIKVRPLAAFMAGLTVMIVFCLLIVLYLFRLFSAQHAVENAPAAGAATTKTVAAPADEQLRWPVPRVQSRPADDLKALRSEEEQTLTTYAWVDRPNGVVRVPVDVAMTLVLKEGLPSR
jgi:hypothetical protein